MHHLYHPGIQESTGEKRKVIHCNEYLTCKNNPHWQFNVDTTLRQGLREFQGEKVWRGKVKKRQTQKGLPLKLHGQQKIS